MPEYDGNFPAEGSSYTFNADFFAITGISIHERPTVIPRGARFENPVGGSGTYKKDTDTGEIRPPVEENDSALVNIDWLRAHSVNTTPATETARSNRERIWTHYLGIELPHWIQRLTGLTYLYEGLPRLFWIKECKRLSFIYLRDRVENLDRVLPSGEPIRIVLASTGVSRSEIEMFLSTFQESEVLSSREIIVYATEATEDLMSIVTKNIKQMGEQSLIPANITLRPVVWDFTRMPSPFLPESIHFFMGFLAYNYFLEEEQKVLRTCIANSLAKGGESIELSLGTRQGQEYYDMSDQKVKDELVVLLDTIKDLARNDLRSLVAIFPYFIWMAMKRKGQMSGIELFESIQASEGRAKDEWGWRFLPMEIVTSQWETSGLQIRNATRAFGPLKWTKSVSAHWISAYKG